MNSSHENLNLKVNERFILKVFAFLRPTNKKKKYFDSYTNREVQQKKFTS